MKRLHHTLSRLSARQARLGAVLATALLSACGNMAELPPNIPLQQVELDYGRPDLRCRMSDGTERVIWTQQPMGQYAWGSNVAADGNLEQVQSLLNDQQFERLKTGAWTPDDVRCMFGPPAIIDAVGLPSSRQIVWSYRYKQASAWDSLMYVYFGSDGKQVTRFHPGPDPMFLSDGSWLW